MAHQNPKGRASFLSDIKGVKLKAAGGFRTFRHERLTDLLQRRPLIGLGKRFVNSGTGRAGAVI
jgi:hypothetical protein